MSGPRLPLTPCPGPHRERERSSRLLTPTISTPCRETTAREIPAVPGALACPVLRGCRAREERR